MERTSQLLELNDYLSRVDKEVTMVLQTLQWDRKQLMEGPDMVKCNHNPEHRAPFGSKIEHEEKCFLLSQGYSKDDKMLPDPPFNATHIVRFGKNDKRQIIEKACQADPDFKKGPGNQYALEPMTAERLQSTYTADERRAFYDAVIATVPDYECDAADFTMPSSSGEVPTSNRAKSRAQLLAELRDMKRRRTKYRVAAKTKNYSDVLRDVIRAQMESYSTVIKDNSEEQPDKAQETPTNRERNRDLGDKEKIMHEKRDSDRHNTHEQSRLNSSRSQTEYTKEKHRERHTRERIPHDIDRYSRNRDKERTSETGYRIEKIRIKEEPSEIQIKVEKEDRKSKSKYRDDRSERSRSRYDDRHRSSRKESSRDHKRKRERESYRDENGSRDKVSHRRYYDC